MSIDSIDFPPELWSYYCDAAQTGSTAAQLYRPSQQIPSTVSVFLQIRRFGEGIAGIRWMVDKPHNYRFEDLTLPYPT